MLFIGARLLLCVAGDEVGDERADRAARAEPPAKDLSRGRAGTGWRGIVEEVSGVGFDILLGLPWTDLPYWHAVYGGYGYATGRAGSVRAPLGGGLCAELTKQFMAGGTMGWFTCVTKSHTRHFTCST